MLRTANQRIAALVLVGGVIALVLFLALALTIPFEHTDWALAWYAANFLSVSKFSSDDFFEIDPDLFVELYTYFAVGMTVALILSYGTGLLLASRTLLTRWRAGQNTEVRQEFRLKFPLDLLILLGCAIAGGSLIWFIDRFIMNLDLAWIYINAIVCSQLTSACAMDPYAIDSQFRAANVMMAALAFSYALSLALAVWTLWQRWRAPIGTTE